MTWGSFVEYWTMLELAQEDAILRNYNVRRFNGNGSVGLVMALKRAGLQVDYKEDALNYIPEVAARLQAMGQPYVDYEQVRQRLISWYTWDRIRKGDIMQWFKADHRR